jgi:hypothetical protein
MIGKQNARDDYLADGINKVWGFDFDVWKGAQGEQIKLFIKNEDKSVEEITDGFNVSLQNKTVVYPMNALTPAVKAGKIVIIARYLPMTQTSDFTTQGAYTPKMVENALDYEMMIAQQEADGVNALLRGYDETSVEIDEEKIEKEIAIIKGQIIEIDNKIENVDAKVEEIDDDIENLEGGLADETSRAQAAEAQKQDRAPNDNKEYLLKNGGLTEFEKSCAPFAIYNVSRGGFIVRLTRELKADEGIAVVSGVDGSVVNIGYSHSGKDYTVSGNIPSQFSVYIEKDNIEPPLESEPEPPNPPSVPTIS